MKGSIILLYTMLTLWCEYELQIILVPRTNRNKKKKESRQMNGEKGIIYKKQSAKFDEKLRILLLIVSATGCNAAWERERER